MIKAVAYMRTSSGANVGEGKDSEPRQRAAIVGFADEAGYEIDESDFYYDKVVRGADAITDRPGFAEMLARIAANGVRVIIVESPDRFARDLLIQLTGHDHLKKLGITLIPASAPDFFTEETPTAVLVRQVLGAIAQFEKATLVAKLRAARERKKQGGAKCEGRKSIAEKRPEVVRDAIAVADGGASLRHVSAVLATLGHLTPNGKPYSPSAVRRMLSSGD
jgi:DNA invertase Pin-like site-specific DNA recombinase